jgi:hypothetical protein
VTLENVEVDLRAGQEINLKPGVHFQSGSTVHLKIEFEDCTRNTNEMNSPNSGSGKQNGMRLIDHPDESNQEESESRENTVRLYPNPSQDGTFVLQSGEEALISGLRIFTTFGILIADIEENKMQVFRFEKPLPTGTYIIQVMVGNDLEIHKLVVL